MSRRPSNQFKPTWKPGTVLVEVVSGSAGACLCVGDDKGGDRVAGPKPWGGGVTIHTFRVDIAELRKVLDEYEKRVA